MAKKPRITHVCLLNWQKWTNLALNISAKHDIQSHKKTLHDHREHVKCVGADWPQARWTSKRTWIPLSCHDQTFCNSSNHFSLTITRRYLHSPHYHNTHTNIHTANPSSLPVAFSLSLFSRIKKKFKMIRYQSEEVYWPTTK